MAAVDLGASGGRVIAGRVSASGVELHEVSRFPNEPVLAGRTLHWDILALYRSVCSGLSTAASTFALASAGIDTWGVDYGLLDAAGALIGNPVHYRDSRTDGVTVPVPAETLYAVTGIQHLPINTIYQLAAAAGTPALAAARTLLLIPDLLAYWLTGSAGVEVTNASTTGLLDVTTRTWAAGLIEQAGIPAGIFPPLRQPGDLIGPITAGRVGAGPAGAAPGPDAFVGGPGAFARGRTEPLPLVAVGSHDTASAVVAVPASGPRFAYISSGTWSLAGLELDAPVLTEESRLANFTNEAGIDGTVRYLRNVTGLWLLQECLRTWGVSADSASGPAAGPGAWPDTGPLDLDSLLAAAAERSRCSLSLTRTTRCSCRRATCRPASAPGCPRAISRCRPVPRNSSGASWTAWRSRTGAHCWPPSRCPASTRTWSTSSAAGPATTCSASSPPTQPGCRWWPARPRRPPSATSSCRPARSARPRRHCRACGPSCDPAWRCGPSRRPARAAAGRARRRNLTEAYGVSVVGTTETPYATPHVTGVRRFQRGASSSTWRSPGSNSTGCRGEPATSRPGHAVGR